jgi:hypothetical protein
MKIANHRVYFLIALAVLLIACESLSLPKNPVAEETSVDTPVTQERVFESPPEKIATGFY